MSALQLVEQAGYEVTSVAKNKVGLDCSVVLFIPVYVDAKNACIPRQVNAVPKHPVQPCTKDYNDVGLRLKHCPRPVEAQRVIVGDKATSHGRRDEGQA